MSGPQHEREFEARFISKYEREITSEEIKYLSLAEVALGEEEHPSIHLVPKKNEAA
jgi:hypothetical protein